MNRGLSADACRARRDYVSGDIDEEYLAALEAGGRGKGRKGAA